MKVKPNLDIYSSDFWYDLTLGGYLKPEQILENEEDIKKVQEAIKVLMDFEQSCDEQIENFFQ